MTIRKCRRRSGDPVRFGVVLLFTPKQVARMWGLRAADLDAMARDGSGPAFVLIRGRRRYPFDSMKCWIESKQLDEGGAQ
jgi:hypothetical protein